LINNIREFPINIGFLWNSINQLRNKRKVKLFNLFLKIHIPIRIGLVNRKQFYFIEKLNYKFKLKIAISFLWNIHINMPGDDYIFFNTSMLGLVTSSNLIQIYFFGTCRNVSYLLIGFWGFWSFRDLFKIANNWIPNNGINSLLTTLYNNTLLGATLALAQRDIKRSLAILQCLNWV
ncbi:hypothetical protein ACJX0J_002504, partial [Zea mays]